MDTATGVGTVGAHAGLLAGEAHGLVTHLGDSHAKQSNGLLYEIIDIKKADYEK